MMAFEHYEGKPHTITDVTELAKAREEFEKEWMSQSEWQDYRNWLTAELYKAREENITLRRAVEVALRGTE